MMGPTELAKVEALPLHSRTPAEWARGVLAEPIRLLIDHAFLEKKAANNALGIAYALAGRLDPRVGRDDDVRGQR